ncbi:MAG: ribonuclease D [Pseudomonadales bacterium]|jgi:ribonuclease D|tara:strand:- start:7975 stop:9108 length:1134 start_codon:yes stop_codon:yes gene_type:complete
MNPEFEIVTSAERLEEVASHCEKQPVLAIDTEFARTSTYYPIVGLIQIYDGESCFLIDPLEVTDLSCLSTLLTDDSIVKVFHACSEDIEVFKYCIGVAPTPVFDTQIAAAMLGDGFSLSYQKLVEKNLSIDVPKEETRSDWLQRPLTDSQLQYAALDVIYLFEVYHKQADNLAKKERLSWVQQECESLPKDIATQIDPHEYYLKVKNIARLNRDQLSLLRELCAWREIKARSLNVPRNRVVDEKGLLLVALNEIQDTSGLQSLANLHPREVRKHGVEILQIVQNMDSDKASELPESILKPRVSIDNKLLKKLKAVVDTVAESNTIAPEMLAKRRHLEQLLRSVNNKGLYQLPNHLTGWREAVVGNALLDCLKSSSSR